MAWGLLASACHCPPHTPRPSRLSQGSCWEPVNLHGSVRGRSSGGWGRGPGARPLIACTYRLLRQVGGQQGTARRQLHG